jgi:hypothetical protein
VIAIAIATAAVPVASWTASAGDKDEKVVTLDKIPEPARKTLVAEAAGSPILKVEEEKQKDRTLYEAQVQKGKDILGIRVDAAGKLIDKHWEKNEKK